MPKRNKFDESQEDSINQSYNDKNKLLRKDVPNSNNSVKAKAKIPKCKIIIIYVN